MGSDRIGVRDEWERKGVAKAFKEKTGSKKTRRRLGALTFWVVFPFFALLLSTNAQLPQRSLDDALQKRETPSLESRTHCCCSTEPVKHFGVTFGRKKSRGECGCTLSLGAKPRADCGLTSMKTSTSFCKRRSYNSTFGC